MDMDTPATTDPAILYGPSGRVLPDRSCIRQASRSFIADRVGRACSKALPIPPKDREFLSIDMPVPHQLTLVHARLKRLLLLPGDLVQVIHGRHRGCIGHIERILDRDPANPCPLNRLGCRAIVESNGRWWVDCDCLAFMGEPCNRKD